jgi:hypothetical protein
MSRSASVLWTRKAPYCPYPDIPGRSGVDRGLRVLTDSPFTIPRVFLFARLRLEVVRVHRQGACERYGAPGA